MNSDANDNPYATPRSEPAIDEFRGDADKRGVGGWLLFLCISLTFVSPIATALRIHTARALIEPFAEVVPGLVAAFVLQAIGSSGFAILSVIAGVRMWLVKPKAVRLAKVYLLASLAWSLVAGGLPLVLSDELGERVAASFIGAWIFSAGIALLSTSIAMAYLSLSRRVARTYDLELPNH